MLPAKSIRRLFLQFLLLFVRHYNIRLVSRYRSRPHIRNNDGLDEARLVWLTKLFVGNNSDNYSIANKHGVCTILMDLFGSHTKGNRTIFATADIFSRALPALQ
jgi:hypothetical protein